MTKIFGKYASQKDFDLIMGALHEGSSDVTLGFFASSIRQEIENIRKEGRITESQFETIADKCDGVFIEETPGRLTIPEIRAFRNQVSHFEELSAALSKYGYAQSQAFVSLARKNGGRFEYFEKYAAQSGLSWDKLPSYLKEDRHFIIALIQKNRRFYESLPIAEMSDPDYAVQYVRAFAAEDAHNFQYRLFDAIPVKLRFDAAFLNSCKTAVEHDYGKNLIAPENFAYLWWPENAGRTGPELKEYSYWLAFYNGDHEWAFSAAANGKIVPDAVLKDVILTGPEASKLFAKLPPEQKLNTDLARSAMAHDPEVALFLPKDSPLLEEATTWRGLLANKERSRYVRIPPFPQTLLADTALLNDIIATKPELLAASFWLQQQIPIALLHKIDRRNLPAFVAAFPEAYDALAPEMSSDLAFAKELILASPYGPFCDKLYAIHDTELAIFAIRADPYNFHRLPIPLRNDPALESCRRELIAALTDKNLPSWAVSYFEYHTDEALELIDSHPDWFTSLFDTTGLFRAESAEHSQRITQHRQALRQRAMERFADYVTTPERMTAYLAKCYTLGELSWALSSYAGPINDSVARTADMLVALHFQKIDGKTPNYPPDIAQILLNKYHIVPHGISQDEILKLLDLRDSDGHLDLLKNSGSQLPDDVIEHITSALLPTPKKLFTASKTEPRILEALGKDEWQQVGPALHELIAGDLAALADLYALLPLEMRSDRALSLQAVVADSDNVFYLPPHLAEDQGFLTEICGWTATPAYDLKNMSTEAQAAAVARWPSQYHLTEPELRQNPEFLQACLDRNMWLFDELTAQERALAWPAFQDRLRREGFLQSDAESWEEFVSVLATRSVAPKRIRSLKAWKAAFPDLFRPPGSGIRKDDHAVLILASKEDWNGAFSVVPVVDRLVEMGIARVDYVEVGSETELKAALARARASGIRYDEVFLAGHGTRESLALGGADRRLNPSENIIADELYVDFSDFDANDFDFSQILKDDGRLIDFSCSNGEGGDQKDNIANRLATTITPTQTVVASQVVTNIVYMDRDGTGHVRVYWDGNSPYVVAGKKGMIRP